MRHEKPDHTLQATALVNEAYMRLVDQRSEWKSRSHFFAIAAHGTSTTMRYRGTTLEARPERPVSWWFPNCKFFVVRERFSENGLSG
jgi:hypothetical protein